MGVLRRRGAFTRRRQQGPFLTCIRYINVGRRRRSQPRTNRLRGRRTGARRVGGQLPPQWDPRCGTQWGTQRGGWRGRRRGRASHGRGRGAPAGGVREGLGPAGTAAVDHRIAVPWKHRRNDRSHPPRFLCVASGLPAGVAVSGRLTSRDASGPPPRPSPTSLPHPPLSLTLTYPSTRQVRPH